MALVSLKHERLTDAGNIPPTPQIESLIMDAKARGLEESSPRAISLQQIIVALNMVSKVICIHHCKDAYKTFSKMWY